MLKIASRANLYKELFQLLYCRNLSAYAHQLFDKIPERFSFLQSAFPNKKHEGKTDLHCAKHEKNHHEALLQFGYGSKSNKYVLCAALNSCAKKRNLQLGLQIHCRVIRTCYDDKLFISSALVDMYGKCGLLADARKVFDEMLVHDQVSWTSIITGFSQNGNGNEAIFLFKEMLWTEFRPTCLTYVSVISGCVQLESAYLVCTSLHAHVTQLGYESNSFVVSSLIDCYSKCGQIDHAVSLFNAVDVRDNIILNSMISGYSRNQYSEEALELFMEMRKGNVNPTEHTLTSILNACGSLTVLQQGKQFHALIIKMGSDQNVFIVSSLIDVYSKCGNVDEARCIFDQTAFKNSILWTSMITGYAQNGKSLNGLQLFDQLIQKQGFVLDNICFSAVITACNHAGFLEKGVEYFNKMKKDFNLNPDIDNYACLVDLYARKGNLTKAKEVIEQMPFKPNAIIWSSFLSSCKVYGELELGKEAAYKVLELEPDSPVPYLTLANLYAGSGSWSEMGQIKKTMNVKGLKKNAGWSWIEIENKVHVFTVGDLSHLYCLEIYMELEKLSMEMKTWVSERNVLD